MAVIDFKCKKCGKEFFEIVSSNDTNVECPECKSTDIERLYKGKYYGKGGGCGSGSCSSCGGGCSH